MLIDIDGVYVEITEGHVFRTGDFLTSEAKLKLPYKRAPIMGSSISVSEIDHASGTFGGYLELFNADVVKTCGLSCHHVLFPIAPADLTLADLSKLPPDSSFLSLHVNKDHMPNPSTKTSPFAHRLYMTTIEA